MRTSKSQIEEKATYTGVFNDYCYGDKISKTDCKTYNDYNMDGCLKRASMCANLNPDYHLNSYLSREKINFGFKFYNDFYEDADEKGCRFLEGFKINNGLDKYWTVLSVLTRPLGYAFSRAVCSMTKKKLITQSVLYSYAYINETAKISNIYEKLGISKEKEMLYSVVLENEYEELIKRFAVLLINANIQIVKMKVHNILQDKYKDQEFYVEEFLRYKDLRKKTTENIKEQYELIDKTEMTEYMSYKYKEVIQKNHYEITFNDFSMFIIINKEVYVFQLKSIVSYAVDCKTECIQTQSFILPFLLVVKHKEHSRLVEFVKSYPHFIPVVKISVFKHFDECKHLFHLEQLEPKKAKVLNDDQLADLFGEEKTNTSKKSKKAKAKKTKVESEKVESENEKVESENEKVESECESVEEQIEPIVEENEPTSTTIIDTFKAPYNISFKNYEWFKDRRYITYLIDNLYKSSIKFQRLIGSYDYIRILQDLHYDMSGKANTLHFNIQLFNSQTLCKSNVLHSYIADSEIYSLTELVNHI